MNARLIALCILLAAVAASNWYFYERGKASVIRSVVAGAATFQKKEVAVAKEDVKQASADTQTITQLETERDNLRSKNQKLQAAAKATGNSEALPEHACLIEPDILDSLRKAASDTKPKAG